MKATKVIEVAWRSGLGMWHLDSRATLKDEGIIARFASVPKGHGEKALKKAAEKRCRVMTIKEGRKP